MRKALVLGGGGARGAYEMGIWKSLRENKKEFDLIIGTSIGALMGTLMVQGSYEAGLKLWENITIDQIAEDGINLDLDWELLKDQKDKILPALSSAIKEKGMDNTPLYRLIKKMTKVNKLRKSKTELYITTMEVPSFTPLVVNLQEINEEEIADYLIASAACFPIFPLKIIGDRTYVDGGYYDNVPIQAALDLGATEIVAVDLKAPGIIRKRRKHEPGITMIEPYWSLGAFFSFNAAQAKRNITLGYLDAQKAFGKLLGYAYSFSGNIASLGDLDRQVEMELKRVNEKLHKGMIPNIEMKLSGSDQKLIDRYPLLPGYQSNLLRLIERLMELRSYDPEMVYDLKKTVRALTKAINDTEISDIKDWLADFIKEPSASIKEFEGWDFLVALAEAFAELDSEVIGIIYRLFPSECLIGLLISCLKSRESR